MINWDKYEVKEGGLNVDRMWPEKGQVLMPGDGIEGQLVGKVANVGPHKSNVYVLEVDNGKEKVGVWGSTVLDSKLGDIAIGKVVAIEYIGDNPSKGGGKPYHDFKVGEGILVPGDEKPY